MGTSLASSKATTSQILGLVAGEGTLPATLAQSAKARGYDVVALALSEDAAALVRPHCVRVFEIYPGQLSRNLKLAHSEGIREAVLIGKVPKLNLLRNVTKLDWNAVRELSKLTSWSDDSIQQMIGGVLEREGIKVRSQAEFLRHLFPEVGVLTRRQPSAAEYADIEYGVKMAKEIARLDIGQTIVVKDRIIVAVEGIEGTDEAIKRGVELARKPVVAIKVAKPGHDPRFDTPAVGVTTLTAMKAPTPGGVLAIAAQETMLVDRDEALRFADEHEMSIVVV
jgi:DUF1009 family protein